MLVPKLTLGKQDHNRFHGWVTCSVHTAVSVRVLSTVSWPRDSLVASEEDTNSVQFVNKYKHGEGANITQTRNSLTCKITLKLAYLLQPPAFDGVESSSQNRLSINGMCCCTTNTNGTQHIWFSSTGHTAARTSSTGNKGEVYSVKKQSCPCPRHERT